MLTTRPPRFTAVQLWSVVSDVAKLVGEGRICFFKRQLLFYILHITSNAFTILNNMHALPLIVFSCHHSRAQVATVDHI